MNKAHNLKNWENFPSINTPINAQNLNELDISVDVIDNRVIALDETKATKLEISTLFKEVGFDQQTGIITFSRKNGATVTIDTPMEKIQTGIYYNPTTEKLVLPLIDGTEMEVDLSRLMKFDEFIDSETISFSVNANGTLAAIIKEGSIEEKHLRPDYLADIKIEVVKAKSIREASEKSATESESYAHGRTGTRDGEETDNSEYFYNKSKEIYDNFSSVGNVTGVKGNDETAYRTGNVNITSANIGAAPISHASTATTYGVSSSTNYGHAMASSTTPKANGTAAVGTETAKFARGDHVHPAQTSVSGSSGSCTGNAATATKLATDRTIQTDLASTSIASFDGSSNITPGVTGTLPVANGGTGKATLTSGQVLVGAGTGAVTTRAIDTKTGGTQDSTALITSGAVKAGLDSCAKTIKSGTVTGANVTFSIDNTKNYLLIGHGGVKSYNAVAVIMKGYLISLTGTLFSLAGTTVTVVYPSSSYSYEVIQL